MREQKNAQIKERERIKRNQNTKTRRVERETWNRIRTFWERKKETYKESGSHVSIILYPCSSIILLCLQLCTLSFSTISFSDLSSFTSSFANWTKLFMSCLCASEPFCLLTVCLSILILRFGNSNSHFFSFLRRHSSDSASLTSFSYVSLFSLCLFFPSISFSGFLSLVLS